MANMNDLLKEAQKSKKDEFYTQMVDIEKELKYYRNHFKGKIVFCNCDDPFESNFFKYFVLNFNKLGLKKLISTSYASSPYVGQELSMFEDQGKEYKINNKKAYKVVVSEININNKDGGETLEDIKEIIRHRIRYLKEDGDFRSEECIEMLQEADIVVTNPPFSLFKEYFNQLMEYDKKFLIIASINVVTYKEIFPIIKNNKAWLGHSIHSGDREFRVPDEYPLKAAGFRIDEQGNKFIRVKGVRWITNLDYSQRHEDVILYKKYVPEEYPTYDNYEAIDVSKVVNIPYDYDGVMGVPITFLDKYNPDQFEIVGLGNSKENFTPKKTYVKAKKITRTGKIQSGAALNNVLTLKVDNKPINTTYYISDNGEFLIAPYARLLIKRRRCNDEN